MNLVVLSSYSYTHKSRNSFVFFEILFKLDQHLHIAFLLSTVVDCGALTDPANGQVSHPDGTTFGETATYSCNPDYNLVGDSTRTCEATGDWSGSEPTCQCNSCNSSFCSYNTQSETASQDRHSMTVMLTKPILMSFTLFKPSEEQTCFIYSEGKLHDRSKDNSEAKIEESEKTGSCWESNLARTPNLCPPVTPSLSRSSIFDLNSFYSNIMRKF